jgi:hypothetical protein
MSSKLTFDFRIQDEQSKNTINASYTLNQAPFFIASMEKVEQELKIACREVFKQLVDSGALALNTRELIDNNFVGSSHIHRKDETAANSGDFHSWSPSGGMVAHLPETLHSKEDY